MQAFIKPFFLISSVMLLSFCYNPSNVNSFTSSIPSIGDARFQKAVKVVLKHEGNLSNDKNDPGGITHYGISIRFLKSADICLDANCSDDAYDIIHLTQTDADRIYLNQFWLKYKFYKIKDDTLATKIFDLAVNVGPARAIKMTKEVLNKIFDDGDELPINGTLDNDTFECINLLPAALLINQLKIAEEDYYLGIVSRNPPLRHFEMGWLSRAKYGA